MFWCSDCLSFVAKLLYNLWFHPSLPSSLAFFQGYLRCCLPGLKSPKFPPHKIELSTFRLWIFFSLTIWLRSFPDPFLVPPPLSCLKVGFSRAEYTDLTRLSFPHHPRSREMQVLLFVVYSTWLQINSGKPNGGQCGITDHIKEALGRGCWLSSPFLAGNEQLAEGVLYTALNPCELACH